MRPLLYHGVGNDLWKQRSNKRQSSASLKLVFNSRWNEVLFTWRNKPTLPNKKQPVTFPHPETGHNKLILCKHLSTKFSSFEVRMPWELELGISPPQSLGPEGFVLGHYKQCAGMLTNIRNQCVNLFTMAECSLAMGTGPVLRPITLGKMYSYCPSFLCYTFGWGTSSLDGL